jgi:hypothetical protein
MALNIERSTGPISLSLGGRTVRELVGAAAPWSVAAPRRREVSATGPAPSKRSGNEPGTRGGRVNVTAGGFRRQAIATLSIWVKMLSFRSSGATAVTTVCDGTWTM